MSGNFARKREGKGEKISLPVSLKTKEKWNEVEKALAGQGYEIDADQTDRAVRRIIRSLEAAMEVVGNPGRPKRNELDPERVK